MNRFTVVAVFIALFVTACDSSNPSSEPESINPSDYLEIVFPLTNTYTNREQVIVKGHKVDGLTAIESNGVDADFSTYDDFWTLSWPLESFENQLSLSLTVQGESFDLNNVLSVTQGDIEPADFPNSEGAQADTGEHYFVSKFINTIFRYDPVTAAIEPDFVLDKTEIGTDDFAYSLEGDLILTHQNQLFFNAYTTAGNMALLSYTLDTQTLNVAISPSSANFDTHFDNGIKRLSYFPNLGTQGQIALTTGEDDRFPIMYDIATESFAELGNMDAYADVAAAGRQSRGFYPVGTEFGLFQYEDAQDNDEFSLIDLTSCDGQAAGCTLDVTPLPTVNNNTCSYDIGDSSSYWYHALTYSLVYENRGELCAVNLHTAVAYRIFQTAVADYGTYPEVFVSGDLFFFRGRDDVARQVSLTSTYMISEPALGLAWATTAWGDESVETETPRNVVIDQENRRAFWLDRDTDSIYALDMTDTTWTRLAHQENIHWENAAYNPEDESLYTFSDAYPSILYKINTVTGEVSEEMTWDDAGTDELRIYHIEAIVLDEATQTLYIANRTNSHSQIGFGANNFFAYNLQSKLVDEVATISDDATFKDAHPSYDMEFDPIDRQLLFYWSGSSVGFSIVSVNVDNGARGLFANDAYGEYHDLSINNARGLAWHATKQQLLFTSQDHEALVAIDAETGEKSLVSYQNYENGPATPQPIGLDIIEDDDTAFVADEGADALFMFDLTTGQRVLVQK